jgi:hypothetical protein
VSKDSAAAVTVTNSTVSGADNLIVVEPDANASLAGPLLDVSGTGGAVSGLTANSSVVDIRGALSSTTTAPFIGVDPTVFATTDFLRIVGGSGGSLTLAGPLLTDVQGFYAASGDFLSIQQGGALTASSASPLLHFSGSVVAIGGATSTAPSHLLTLGGSGSSVTLGGSLAGLTNSSVIALNGGAGSALLGLGPGTLLTSSSGSPVIDLSGSVLGLGTGVRGLLGTGGSANVSGGLLRATAGSTIAADMTVPLVELSNTSVNVGGALVRLEGGSALQSGGVKLTGGSLTANTLLSTDGASNSVAVAGSVLDLTNATATLQTLADHDQPGVNTDTVSIPLSPNQPVLRLSSSTLSLGKIDDVAVGLGVGTGLVPTIQGVALVANGTQAATTNLNLQGTLLGLEAAAFTATEPLVQLDHAFVSQSGTTIDLLGALIAPGLTATMTGPLLGATDSTINTSGRLFHFTGGSLTSNTTSPFLFFDPSIVNLGFTAIEVDNGSSLTLAGPLVSAQSTPFNVTNPTSNVYTFFSVRDGSKVSSTAISPFLTFDGSSFDGGSFVSVRRSASVLNPSTLTLSGPLLSAVNGSSFNTSSLGLGATLGTTGGVCCSLVSVTQGGLLSSTTTAPLVQVSGSTVNAGPDAQSGGTIFNIADTFGGAIATELVAPSSMTLSGPLLRSDNSTLTALFHLLRVGNSSLTATTPDPLVQLNNNTVSLGGFDPFANATSAARLLNLSGSAASPASLTLNGSLFRVVNSTVVTTDDMFGIFDSSTLTSATTSALLSFSGGSATAGAPNGNFIVLASSLGLSPSVSLAGPLLNAANTTLKNGDPATGTSLVSFMFVGDSAQLSSTSSAPLLAFDHASVVSSSDILSLRRSLSTANPTRLILSGPLFSATNGSSFDTTSRGLGSACCDTFGVRQAAELTSTTTAPLLQLSGGSTVNAGPDAQSGGDFFGMSDSSIDGPVTAPAKVSLAGPLLSLTGGSSINALFHLLSVVRSNFSSTTASPLIGLNTGTVSLGGLDPFSNTTTGGRILNLSGTATSPGTLTLQGPLFSAESSAVTTTAEPFGIFAGGSLTTTQTSDPLISLSGGAVNAGAHFMQVRGFAAGGSVPATVTLSDPLLSTAGTTLNISGNLLRLADGGSLLSGTDKALITLSGGSYTGAPLGSGLGGSLLRMFSEVGQAGTLLSISGPYLAANNLAYNAPDANGFSLTDGAVVSSTGSGPFASFTGGTVSTRSSFFAMANNTSFTTPGQPTTVGNGMIPSLTLLGTGSQTASLLNFQGTNVIIGDPNANTSTLLFVGDGSTVFAADSRPLLRFDGATVDLAGSVLSLRRSPSPDNPSTLTLSGPLFSAVNNSTLNTTSLGFGPSFGTAGACCTAFFISQGARLTSTTTEPLIQLTASHFDAGPDPQQSGASFIDIVDTFGGAPATELVAPPAVNLAGALLKADGSTITALGHLVQVGRGSLGSSTTDALIQLDGSTASLGGVNPIGNVPTQSGLFFELASATGGTVGSPASVSLAGPLLSATDSNLTMTRDLVGVFNGATLTSSTTDALVQVNGGLLTTSTASGFNGFVLDISGTGGPGGSSGLSTVSLKGPVFSGSYSGTGNLDLAGGLANITNGGLLIVPNLTTPLFSITGGDHVVNRTLLSASGNDFAMLRFLGRATETTVDSESGLTVGTDRMIQGPLQPNTTMMPVPVALLETTGATVSGQKVVKIDHALLEATAPLLSLRPNGTTPSVLTSATDAVDLSVAARITSLGSSLIRLDNSILNVTNGSLINVNASKLVVSGDLVSLLNGATLNILNGPLLSVSGNGFASITGGLISFGGTGGNALNVTNALAPTGFINGVPVFSSLGGTTGFTFTNPTPLVGLNTLGTIKVNGTVLPNNATAASGITGSLLAIQAGGGKVKVGP